MKENNHILSLAETEELCRMYMDCELSVREETEFQYVLGKLPYSSPLIDEVRTLMGLQSAAALRLKPETINVKRRKEWNIRWVAGIAASVVILLGIGVALFRTNGENEAERVVNIAYSNGIRLTGEQLMAQIQRDNARTDAFIKRMDDMEAEEIEADEIEAENIDKFDEFFNN